MGIENQKNLGTSTDPTPRTTKVDVGAVTPRVTPLGRSPTTRELYASGRREMAATWSPSTKPVPTKE